MKNQCSETFVSENIVNFNYHSEKWNWVCLINRQERVSWKISTSCLLVSPTVKEMKEISRPDKRGHFSQKKPFEFKLKYLFANVRL